MLFPSTLIGILEFLTSGSILRITKAIQRIHVLYACVSAVVVGIGIAQFHQTNFVFNLIVPFTILLILFEITRKVGQSGKEIVALFVGLFCIIICGVNDLFVGLWIWPQNPLILPVGFVGFSIAVTYATIAWAEQRKELTKRLEVESAQLSAAVNTIQTVAHDVRRPFAMIKMVIDMLETIKDTQEQKKCLMIAKPEIEQATSSAESLIQDLLNLGKPIKLDIGPSSITAVIEKSLLLVGPTAKEKEASLKISLCHRHQLQIDAGKIERALVNILQNALEAMPHQAELNVRTAEAESKISIFLRNSGSYIERKDLRKIFDKFHTSGKANGTGLGLHISKQFVEAHGGEIECQSSQGRSASENFVEFKITFTSSDILDRANLCHQLDRYFLVKNV
jgi:signal transduction histidine kinase